MNTQNPYNSPLGNTIHTPESVIASALRLLNGTEFPERYVSVRGSFTPTSMKVESRNAFAQLTGKTGNSIRLFFADNEGNLDKYSLLVPNMEYDMSGTLTFYNYKGNVCIQLVPLQIVPAQTDALDNAKAQYEQWNQMKESLRKRKMGGWKNIPRLVLECMDRKKSMTVLLIRPKSATAEKDIMGALDDARDFYRIKPNDCDFTNPSELAQTLLAADRTIADLIVLSRGGRENLKVIDSKEVIDALGKMGKPLVTGLGHEQDHLMAELFADHICNTPTMVGTWLRDLYREAKRELQIRPETTQEVEPVGRPRFSDAKYAKYLQPEPTFYGIRWTDRQPIKWIIWFFCLLGVLQVVSFFW